MDRHSAQKTENMKELYRELGYAPVYTPPGCTDSTSPVDHHVGRYIQNFMARRYQVELETNSHIWLSGGGPDDEEIEDSNGSSAMERRMLMATWLSEAWRHLQNTGAHLLDSAFLQTGFLVALDGSQDHLIQLQGWKGTQYRFR